MEDDTMGEERRRVANLFRWITGMIAWVAVSSALVFLFDLGDHQLHFGAMVVVSLASIFVFVRAKWLAAKFYPVPV